MLERKEGRSNHQVYICREFNVKESKKSFFLELDSPFLDPVRVLRTCCT